MTEIISRPTQEVFAPILLWPRCRGGDTETRFLLGEKTSARRLIRHRNGNSQRARCTGD